MEFVEREREKRDWALVDEPFMLWAFEGLALRKELPGCKSLSCPAMQ